MNVLQFIDGYLNGNAWEELCVMCYRMRYQNEHYTPISAAQGGDGGIEGFTQNGVVHQCYCPEKDYSDEENYEHLRDKMTKDIGKLLKANYKIRLIDWGVPPIVEWHFVIPEQKDSRIVKHAENKRKEVEAAKRANPSDFPHISDDFKVYIKCADDFLLEISKIVLSPHKDYLLNLAIKDKSTLDYSQCDSEKVENIRRKIKAIKNTDDDSDPDVVFLVDHFIKSYLSGVAILNELRLSFPEIHQALIELEGSCKEDVSVKTRLTSDTSVNAQLFNSLLDDFEKKLKEQFSTSVDLASIGELKQDLVASWLADCSMEFRM
ncbi:hypothetical protein M2454_003077 [Aequitasia blattaphilus]|uniref:Uncharacterized protein n=1 Tax=Aequitasia blattaphilus TaxID=2949332 RepID=A0ABT1EE76_9FIRM|nr:hypothetical protein [Aequitasia blattaphilus]MCP1102772.1 hypothetical protein [Aequitasia blattaphilus]MCR8615412.1 hypothetical protein [Aequitasia blattaphilus]